MPCEELLDQAIPMLQRRGRLTSRTLQRQGQLDEDARNDLQDALLYAPPEGRDEAGRGLSWTGDSGPAPAAASAPAATPAPAPLASTPPSLPEQILAAQSPLEGERKQGTGLLADLQGSTAWMAALAPEAAQHRLDPALQTMRDAVHRYEGTVNQGLGDGSMALCGAPLAHADHAVRGG